MKTQHKKILISLIFLFLFLIFLLFLRGKATSVIAHGIALQGEGTNLGGISYERSTDLIADYLERLNQKKITINLDGQTAEVTLQELGVSFHTDHTIEKIKNLSYSNNLIEHYGMRLLHLFTKTEVPPVYEVDQKKLVSKIQTVFPILQGAIDAEIGYDEQGNPFVIPHQDQLTTDFSKISEAIEAVIISPANSYTLNLQATPQIAEYRTETAQSDLEILKNYLKKDISFVITPPTQEEKPYLHKTQIQPNWLQVKNGEIELDREIIRAFISENIAPEVEKEVENAIIKELPAEGSNFALVEGIARDGKKINYEKLFTNLWENLKSESINIEIPIDIVGSKIENQTGVDLGALENLGTGRSGFWGSAAGRRANINKGLNEKVNNILVAPGAEYSFNSNLGPVTSAAGWYNADAIFNGDELIPVPGGGLCQVSTTVYRAALNANMEILERSPHSLYVLYYEEFGNGLDAAIYPGHKDLRFKNNTDGYILIQAYNENDLAYVNIFGTPTGDQVELLGPIYSGRVPEEFQDLVSPRWNQISWIKKTTKADGTTTLDPITSSYRTAPRKLYPYQGN